MNQTEKTFEASLKRLEEITKLLESSETPLEEALALFEEGTGLVRALSARLDEAAQKVTMLTGAAEGKTEEVPFVPQGN